MNVNSERGSTLDERASGPDRKSTRLNSSHPCISYAVFCLKKKSTCQSQPQSATNKIEARTVRPPSPAIPRVPPFDTPAYLRHFSRKQHDRSPFFFFNDTATTEIYTLSLHDALPI